MTQKILPEILRIHDEAALKLLYGPIVLEKALSTTCEQSREGFDDQGSGQTVMESDEYSFRSFVNKLAQICDRKPGGSTVTAMAVCQNPQGPLYVFGSNQRANDDLVRTKDFLTDILNYIGRNPAKFKSKKPLTKQVLWQILEFGIERVRFYLNQLNRYINECKADCQRKKDVELEGELDKLKTRALFDCDMLSMSNTRDKFLSDCETLIKALHANKDTDLEQAIGKRAKDGDMSSSKSWKELRHYCGRLLSYRKAAETLVLAQDRWPELFSDFKVVGIPSSSRSRKPFHKSALTAADIIGDMGLKAADVEHYREKAHELQSFGLDVDAEIQGIVASQSFRPLVHAEILVHARLRRLPIPPAQLYWNGWKYIGSSKPTCRLCAYYFNADEVGVRPGHQNLYHCWRLPDVYSDEPEVTVATQRRLLTQITDRVKSDAMRTLEERRSRGRRHDTNTVSAGMRHPGDAASSIAAMDDLASRTSKLDCDDDDPESPLSASSSGTQGDDWASAYAGSIQSDDEEEDDDDGFGGALLMI